MSKSRRILILVLTALVAVVASAILFGGTAHAQALNDHLAPSPLVQEDPELQQVNKIVQKKQSAIDDQKDQINQLLQKKDSLANQLQDVKGQIDDLQQKIADKKAAVVVEAARVKVLEDMFVHINRYASDASGNMYDPGQCTWYVKSRRPDIGNQWGNANTWYANAAAQGWDVGSTPKKGAVGTTTRGYAGHVVYVEGVSLDGQTITISEMNYNGAYSFRTREASASEFVYIYELN